MPRGWGREVGEVSIGTPWPYFLRGGRVACARTLRSHRLQRNARPLTPRETDEHSKKGVLVGFSDHSTAYVGLNPFDILGAFF